MRVIKFRGLRTDGKGWVVGSYVQKYGEHIICFEQKIKKHIGWRSIWGETQVSPETVSQFTGLLDKNGVEIYYDDIVNVEPTTKKGRYEIVQEVIINGMISLHPFVSDGYHWSSLESEIIGNIHEHKHLLI
jgi:uncharacterized phage protein (TIGR01671 family)